MSSNRSRLVSIGMPVYNEARWIGEALESLLSQTFMDFELIISDNASTDETWQIIQTYAAQDSRIIPHHQPKNCGAIRNFEFVFEQAAGKFFMWAGGHDLWSANLLEVLLSEFASNPRLVLCVPQGVIIDEHNAPINYFYQIIDTRPAKSAAARVLIMHRQMKRANAIYGLHRRDVLQQMMPWPRVAGGDNITLVQIAARGNVITNHSAQWLRRKNRQETSLDAANRRAQVLGLPKFAARFPYLSTRIAIIKAFFQTNGSLRERAKLLYYGVNSLFLAENQRQLLVQEFIAGVLPAKANRQDIPRDGESDKSNEAINA